MFSPKTQKIMRQTDADARFVVCTGGFRAAERDKDIWHIEPVLINEDPCIQGFFTKHEIQNIIRSSGFVPIAFQRIGWTKGNYHSGWTPILPDRANHFRGPAELWHSISSNIQSGRVDFHEIEEPTFEKLAPLVDDKGQIERLAHSISLSLHSMDSHIEQITEYYNDQLVNLMARGADKMNVRSSSSLDQNLYAHVNAFFAHFGAARDYLAALIATRIGKDPVKTDSLSKLLNALKTENVSNDALANLLLSKGYISQCNKTLGKWIQSGWLKEATDLRNEFVHRRPYGQKMNEQMGWLQPLNKERGLYKYHRPIIRENFAETDVLDLVTYHYHKTTILFQLAAEKSGYNSGMMTLNSKDIISIDGDLGLFNS